MNDKIILNISAHQKPSTINPDMKYPAIKMMIALITNKKRPNVIIVMGMVKITKIGFMILFNIANTRATKMADKKLSMCTPGSR